ncbi:uncharacterized protein DUF3225 [Humitalea rosea]|uniref:Uncharacterized protein DUF3225 n=1 Tax=Humitalea rosea TaxID=990373 RepID=A0A2W7KPT4_9PROT|nr:oxalurate catabolism protein HpxZ [Humitalea rosea]PZW50325.1 uncharacterized protein DUF3225 [Humitalea rosea]
MEIDRPEILAEVAGLFAAYETALVTNDVAVLDGLFWQHAKVVRYGATEILHGYAEIAAFRASRPSAGLARTLERTVITTFGQDFATASTTFTRNGRTGRQQQSWVRLPEGWRIVAAHVSFLERFGA